MWKRLDESKLRNVGGEHHLSRRVYGWEGKLWPRLAISIYETQRGYFKLNCSQKKRGRWWETASIPQNLLTDAAEMLLEIHRERTE